MKISDAPTNQERWRVLVDGAFGERAGQWTGKNGEKVLNYVRFGVVLPPPHRRFRIELTPAEAAELREWLDKMLQPSRVYHVRVKLKDKPKRQKPRRGVARKGQGKGRKRRPFNQHTSQDTPGFVEAFRVAP